MHSSGRITADLKQLAAKRPRLDHVRHYAQGQAGCGQILERCEGASCWDCGWIAADMLVGSWSRLVTDHPVGGGVEA